MSEVRPFETVVFQLFHDLLRASGQAMNQNQIENLRSASMKFAEIFKTEAQVACLEYLKEFQENVKESMDFMEAKINQLELPAVINPSLDPSLNIPRPTEPPNWQFKDGQQPSKWKQVVDKNKEKSDN